MELTKDSVALVTGANGGLGQAIARALHAMGARVVLTGRRPDAMAPLAAELGARVIVADLAKREDVTRLLAEVGDVDVLVANAALPASGHLMEFTEDEIDRALDVNLRAPVVMARMLGEGMAKRGRGQIVFISSISGKVAASGTSMYSGTKFGLRGFSLALRADLHKAGVGVTTVFPGFIRDAGMFADTGVTLPRGLGTRSPQQVAAAVLYAVRRNPAEITVAALDQRLGAVIEAFSPGLISVLERLTGADKLGKQITATQKTKR